MDVSGSNFQSLLPSILDAVATAHFVTIDLELSGIPGQQMNKSRAAGESSSGKPTLQQRYEETKTAAERYQVLQFGITCVDEDKDRGVYTLRPYNLFLNPVADGRLDVDRIFSFQSGAVEFLLNHGFRMDAPFVEGVPYYSREEESAARNTASARRNMIAVADIAIKNDDTESLKFIQRVRSEIDAWKNSTETKKEAFLNIAPVGYSSPTFQDRGLNNFQKRLVHQFVRAEYPDLSTTSRPGFIQITAFNKEREDNLQKFRTAAFEDRLKRQVGVRWLVEAMVGGNLAAIKSYNLQPVKSESQVPREHYERLFDRLQAKKTILVGHNVFIDLIYFYACFFGKLPDSVKDFERLMHELFPCIIDTKYLATHGDDNPALSKSSLEELDDQLSSLTPAPVIEMPLGHHRYLRNKPAHEAGFDSYLTAKVLIRLSAKLEAAGYYIDEKISPGSEGEGYVTAPETGGVSLNTPKHPLTSRLVDENARPKAGKSDSNDSISEGVSLGHNAVTIEPQPTKSKTKAKKSKRKSNDTAARSTNFSHATMFDLLGDMPSSDDDLGVPLARPLNPKPSTPRFTMMPPFDSDFWNVYGDKLRVNGTVEGVCNLWPEGRR